MSSPKTYTALITGASRGVGAATAVALAERGFQIAVNYRDPAKGKRAAQVVAKVEAAGSRAFAARADITVDTERQSLFAAVGKEFGQLDLLVLNASGGLEHGKPSDYATRINTEAPLELTRRAILLMPRGASIIFVTSNQAHYGAAMVDEYQPVANSKRAGEDALRALLPELSERGIRLLVVTGDIIRDSATAMLLNRNNEGLLANREAEIGELPTTEQFATAIADAALNPNLESGQTIQVGPMPS